MKTLSERSQKEDRRKPKFGLLMGISLVVSLMSIGCVKGQNLTDLLSVSGSFEFANKSGQLPTAYKNQVYTYNFATNNGQDPVVYQVIQGTVPAGVNLTEQGILTGPVTSAVGIYSFTVQATDAGGKKATLPCTLQVGMPFSLLSAALPGAILDTSYTAVLSATGGFQPYTFAATNLPVGLSLNPATGVITGTPSSLGNSTLRLTITDAATQVINAEITMNVGIKPGVLTITNRSLPNGQAGNSYAAVVLANGGVTPFTFSVDSGALPAGLLLDSNSGVISGTPTAAGPATFIIKVTDAIGSAMGQSYNMNIARAPSPTINTPSLPTGQQNAGYSSLILASGGVAPYSFAVSAGSLPAGLNLSQTTGLLSGTPSVNGSFNFSISVTDAAGNSAALAYNLAISAAPTPSISTFSLNPAIVGASYVGFISAAGGTPPYVFSISTGTLPSGLAISPSTGAIFGTPTTAGSTTIRVTVTDLLGSTAVSAPINLIINAAAAPTITTSLLPSGQAQVYYGGVISAAGGGTPYTYSITNGTLPTGLNLSASTGLISGIPLESGSFNLTFKVTDTLGATSSATLMLMISPAAVPTISSPILPNGQVQAAYSAVILAAGGVTPYTFSVNSGTLPSGLNLGSSTGLLSGTPTTSGNYNFTIKVTDRNGNASASDFSMTITPAPMPQIISGALNPAVVNAAYTGFITATGGSLPYTFSVNSGALPNGLTLSSTTGVIYGTPSSAGTSSFVIKVTDSLNNSALSSNMSLVVNPAAAPTITTSLLPTGQALTNYAGVISASGGQTPYTYSIQTGTLPAGLNLSSSTGLISGTPTASGTVSITFKVTDALGATSTAGISLTISPAATPTIATSTLSNGQQQVPYSAVILASGGATPYNFAVTTGNLPAGLNLSSSTGLISGTPTTAGSSNFAITVTDRNGSSSVANFTLIINPAPIPSIISNTLNPAVVNSAYTGFITAVGGTPPYTYSLNTGALPIGMSMSSSTGVIYGTPTTAGPATFSIKVTDSLSNSVISSVLSLVVNPPTAPTITTSTLPVGQAQASYAGVVTASGGATPYSFSISSGSLPSGLVLNSSSGLISGTPTSSGTFNITVQVSDANSSQSAATFSLSISAAPTPSILTTSLPNGQQQIAYSTVIVASGGASPYTFAVTTGSLPNGLTLNASTGLISGTPTASGNTSFTVTVTDRNSSSSVANYSLTITPSPTPSIYTTTLNPAQVSSAYTGFVTATGGTPPYTYAISTGSLPAGLAISSSTGVIYGTPSTAGTSLIKVSATDSLGNTAVSGSLSLVVNTPTAPTITTSTLPVGQAQASYAGVVSAAGGATPYTFAISSGTLPAGLTLNSATGLIAGTPTTTGTVALSFRVTDNMGSSSSATLALTINPAATPTITTNALPTGQQQIAYSSVILASGGVTPYTFSVSSGSLPTGIVLSSTTGLIAGTPTVSGTYNFTVTVTDNVGSSTAANFSITLAPAPTPTLLTTSLNPAQVNSLYTMIVSASGGTAPYAYSLASGTLPNGITLDGPTGVLTGTPGTAGTSVVKITVTDSLGKSVTSGNLSLVVNPPTAPTITTSTLPSGQAFVPYNKVIQASGGSNPYTFSITTGTLPSGLSLDASSGLISGTPSVSGVFNLTFKVTDSLGSNSSATLTMSLSTAAAPVVSTSTFANAQVTVPYTAVITSTGGSPTYSYSISTGTLPPGLSLHGATGVISGTPTTAGGYNFSVIATDSVGTDSPAKNLAITVIASPYATLAFQNTSLLPLALYQNDSRAVLVTGGLAPYTFAISSGAIPTGMTFNTSTGLVSGVPTGIGTFNFTVQVTDARGSSTSQAYSLLVLQPLIILTNTLSTCTQNVAYANRVYASGGGTPYVFSATGMPSGISIASDSGIISGAASTNGSYSVTITVVEANGLTASTTLTMVVAAPISITTSTIQTAAITRSYSQALNISGGIPPYNFSVTAGSLPTGLTLLSSGLITGSPAKGANAKTGIFNFTVHAQDSAGSTVSKLFTMTVGIPPTVVDDISNKLRNGVKNVTYSDWVKVTGGVGALTYSASGLPSGLSINSTSGWISGNPSADGTYTANITVTDANSISHTRTKKITINNAGKTADFDGGIMTSATSYYGWYNMQSTLAADLNNDGKLDLVVAGGGIRAILIYMGNGDGTFSQPYGLTNMSQNFYDMAIADMTGDGKLDLVISEQGSTVEIFAGDNTWTAPNSLVKTTIVGGTLNNNIQVALGDLNGDGRLDLALANYNSNVFSVFMNCQGSTTVSYNGSTPTCTAGSAINYYQGGTVAGPGSWTYGVGLVDLNGDNKLDLVGTSNNNRTFQIWLGNGNGTFAGSPAYTSAAFPYSLARVRTFKEPLTGWSNTHITTASNYSDFNADGKADFAIEASGGTYVVLGNGSGGVNQTLTADISDIGQGTFARIADVNGDGILDLVSINTSGYVNNIINPSTGAGGQYSALYSTQIFFGSGTGANYSIGGRQYIPNQTFSGVSVGNFITGAAAPALAVSQGWNGANVIYPSVVVRPNTLSSTQPYNYPSFQFAYQSSGGLFYDYSFAHVATGDLNGDGVADFVAKYLSTNSGSAVVYLGSQSGNNWSFASQTGLMATGDLLDQWWNGRQAVLTDIDGDSVLDYANANFNNGQFGTVGYALGNGDGTFGGLNVIATDASGCLTTLGAESVAFADFNRDGKMDMAVGEGCNGSGYVMVFSGNGDGTFNRSTPLTLSTTGQYADIVYTLDINGDGYSDLAVVTRNGYLNLYKGNGDGTFILRVSQSLGLGSNSARLETGDVNNDGIPDYVVSSVSGSSFAVCIGGSNFSISSITPYSGISTYSTINVASVSLADWDADGYLDVIMAKQLAGLQLMRGSASGILSTPTKMYGIPNMGARSYTSTVPLDINGDGLPDLITWQGDNNMMTSVGYSINKSN